MTQEVQGLETCGLDLCNVSNGLVEDTNFRSYLE